MSPPQERSWWGRNWLWVVPVGCLAPFIVCGGCVGLVITLGLGAIKSSEPFQEAVARAKANAAVQAALGGPVEAGFLASGSIQTSYGNGVESGNADLSIPLSGPTGSATLRVVAQKSTGKWTYSTIQVVVAGHEQVIDLLADE